MRQIMDWGNHNMKEKMYISTRGNQKPLNFYEAILQGIAEDGGLLVQMCIRDRF